MVVNNHCPVATTSFQDMCDISTANKGHVANKRGHTGSLVGYTQQTKAMQQNNTVVIVHDGADTDREMRIKPNKLQGLQPTRDSARRTVSKATIKA